MMFYGSMQRDPKEFMGLSEYYGSTDPQRAQNAANVIDAGGTGGASIWFVVWSPDATFMAYHMDNARRIAAAVVPIDWRYVVRIANIDPEGDVNLVPGIITE
jgi:hypothetical protein